MTGIAEYNEMINFLYGLQKHGIKLGLSNTSELMNLLEHPQKSFRSIHIAGTNGKGSTASIISSIFAEHGVKTGLFTSPHLVSFTERISINGRRITEDEVVDITKKLKSIISGHSIQPTFFEFITAMAFLYFRRNDVEWAVVETGMGGRLDATNILVPEVSVITSISMDHSEFLGKSISDIAREKAGIIKPHVPLVTSISGDEALNIIKATSAGQNSALHVYGDQFSADLISISLDGITFDYNGDEQYMALRVPLIGDYQMYNASTAIRVMELLGMTGFPLSEEMIRKGLANLKMEGRMECVSHDPLIFIDGAHNPDAINCSVGNLRKLLPDKKLIIVAGIMSDKEIRGMIAPLRASAEKLILTRAAYERAASSMQLKEAASSLKATGHADIITAEPVKNAIKLAKSLCSKDTFILITGSFYTAGEAKEYFGHPAVLPRLREK
jgi:dihydrofolate synthase/folylpolyglutamate synthase